MLITRREAILKMALLMGSTVVGPRLLAGEFGDARSASTMFSPDDIALLNMIGDTILPDTDVPGAGAVGIGAFIAMMIEDCYRSPIPARFHHGLRELNTRYQTRYGVPLVKGDAADRTEFLNEIDAEQKIAEKDFASDLHPFRLMKELTILGYFTSEVGCTQALRFAEVPGRFDGDVPYRKGDRAWFTKIR